VIRLDATTRSCGLRTPEFRDDPRVAPSSLDPAEADLAEKRDRIDRCRTPSEVDTLDEGDAGPSTVSAEPQKIQRPC